MQIEETFKLTGVFWKKKEHIYTWFLYMRTQIYVCIAEQDGIETENGTRTPISLYKW